MIRSDDYYPMPSIKSRFHKETDMKMTDLKRRLRKDRPKTVVSLKLPDDVIADLQRIAPLLGFSNYQALIRAYIGQGLRADLERESSHAVMAHFKMATRKRRRPLL